ncbi:EF-hand calcium-binding domain-containing protein 7-like isoform X1 [Mytilus edulis]|uniref:EF-hand calcium-binding domain-containing protein 7-like isoform X1 n=1 Tax=Mytilus edulis TaxID=6550 RepID=UPI0039EF2D4D
MSRRSSRSSTMDQGEFILECKAAYLSMFDSIKEKIESQDSLLEALQQTGRNPSVKILKKYWTNDTDELSFDDFVDICKKEPVTTSDDLMKAFRKIDINGDGYISLEELHKILTSKGEKKSKSEVKKMIDEVDENKDGRLDYKEEPVLFYSEFCQMVMSTTEESKKMQRKMMERKEKKKRQDIERRGDISGSQVSVRSAASSVKNQEKSSSKANVESGNGKKEANKENKDDDDDDDDEIDEECVTARSGSARSERPKPSPRKSMSETTTSQAQDVSHSRTSLREKTEDVSGSRTSLQSKDDVLLTSRRSSRSQNKDSSRSKKEKDREGLSSSRLSNSPDKLMGSNSTLQNIPDVIGSNISLTSASGLMAKNLRQNVGTPAGSRKSSLLSIGEGSPPIPAQRKSLLHTASSSDPDDLPRPSPRVKKDKSRQGSVSRAHKLDEPKNLREWTHTKSKGSFFMEDGSLICHQYDFNLPDDSKIWITIQPQKGSRGMDSSPVDTSVFILRDRPDEDGNLLVAFTEHRDSRGKYGVSCDLSAGKYYIMPYTTGCRFKSRKSESGKEAKLVSQDKGGKYVITKSFRKVLEDIFDYSDLDGNGFMSRKEFNLFNIRTSGEEVADEEWQVVEDRIDLEDGEITKAGFLQLNELEAEDSEGDTEDLWTTLVSMGYNKQLVMDQACPFQLDVYTEDCDDAELDVVRVDSYPTYPGDLSFDDIISKSFIKHGEISRVKGMKDLCMYTYTNEGWATLVLDNKSHTRVRVELDCSRSENVTSNHDSLQRTLRVDPGSTVIAYHLMPEDDDRDWQVKCTETIR